MSGLVLLLLLLLLLLGLYEVCVGLLTRVGFQFDMLRNGPCYRRNGRVQGRNGFKRRGGKGQGPGPEGEHGVNSAWSRKGKSG